MSKPVSLPRWADVSGKIVEPPSGKKDVGWVSEEKLPEGFLNWWKNLTYQWLQFVDDNLADDYVEVINTVDGYPGANTSQNTTTLSTQFSATPGSVLLPVVTRPDYVLTEFGVWDLSSSASSRTYRFELLDSSPGGTVGDLLTGGGGNPTKSHTTADVERSVFTSADTGTNLPITMKNESNLARLFVRLTLTAAAAVGDIDLLSVWFKWERRR